jgi:hypothetical protein
LLGREKKPQVLRDKGERRVKDIQTGKKVKAKERTKERKLRQGFTIKSDSRQTSFTHKNKSKFSSVITRNIHKTQVSISFKVNINTNS